MGIKRRNQGPDLGEHAIFGDEEAAELRAQLATVTTRIDELTERVNAQFTSISAHAEISREQMSEVRQEARADMERSREMLIGLIDRLRDERPEAVEPTIAVMRDARESRRIDDIEDTLTLLAGSLERCEQRQRQMAETMSAFIDTMISTMISDELDDPVHGLAIA